MLNLEIMIGLHEVRGKLTSSEGKMGCKLCFTWYKSVELAPEELDLVKLEFTAKWAEEQSMAKDDSNQDFIKAERMFIRGLGKSPKSKGV